MGRTGRRRRRVPEPVPAEEATSAGLGGALSRVRFGGGKARFGGRREQNLGRFGRRCCGGRALRPGAPLHLQEDTGLVGEDFGLSLQNSGLLLKEFQQFRR